MTLHATKARPEKAVAKAAKVVEKVGATDAVDATVAAPARTVKVAMAVVMATSKPSWASLKRTTAP